MKCLYFYHLSKKDQHNGKALFQRVANDDHDAFRNLFDLYADRMYAAVYHHTKSRFIAEELVQEVFVSLWRHRGQLHVVEDPTAYLYRTVFNHINNYMIKAANQRRILDQATERMAAENDTTRQELEAREMKKIISAAIGQLPPQKRTIYRLSREQGLSYQEIAVQLGISPNTVKNHLVEAMKLLRNYLKDHFLTLVVLALRSFL